MKRVISILIVSGIFASFINNAYAGYFINDAKKACPQMIQSSLSFGNSSDEVLFMQNELNREGYFREVPNGYFDNSTTEALQAFQRDNGLLQTGKVGPYTMDYLNQRICGFSSSNGVTGAVGTTVVGSYDAFVRVINAETDKYVAMQNSTQATGNTTSSLLNNTNVLNNSYLNTNTVNTYSNNISIIPPATLINQSTTNAYIVYNSSMGNYTYALSPSSASITITSPGVNSVFHEGDNVKVSWYATNLNVSVYQVLLENTITGKSKEVLTTSANEANISLTKELLDSVCASVCDTYQQSNFQIDVMTPVKDIAGNVTNLKATDRPITIKRDIWSASNANMSASKTPVNSGELFKLYVNISNPNTYLWNNNSNYSFGISANCPTSVSVSIGGTICGQELSMPQMTNFTQKEIPVEATNTGWFAQPVTFNLSVYDQFGRLTGTASTTVQVNPIARSF